VSKGREGSGFLTRHTKDVENGTYCCCLVLYIKNKSTPKHQKFINYDNMYVMGAMRIVKYIEEN
jgi:hypothetical protein